MIAAAAASVARSSADAFARSASRAAIRRSRPASRIRRPASVASRRAERRSSRLDDEDRHDQEQPARGHERAAAVVLPFEHRGVQHVVTREEHEADGEKPDDPPEHHPHGDSARHFATGTAAGGRTLLAPTP